MPRPKTQNELLTATAASYSILNATLDGLTNAQLAASFPFDHRDKNIRDVLAHLHEWQLMMLRWYESGMAGATPEMPAKGYTWKTTPDLNAEIWRRYQNTSLKRIRIELDGSHEALCQIIASHTNAELFTKCHYCWTGSTSLGAYLTSATLSHYNWALRLLRRFTRDISSAVG